MKKLLLVPFFLVIFLAMVNPYAYAMKIQYTFVFVDRFPEESRPLGFTPGNRVQVGAMVKAGDFKITEATATNLNTGLVLELAPMKIGAVYTNLLFLHRGFPSVDPDKHYGVWEIRLKDESGKEVVAKTHKLDIEGKIPYVENIKATGSPFAPAITWTAPKKEDVPPGCKIRYRVRLLKNNRSQFYRSKKVLSDTKEEIPKGFLKYEEIPGTYIRIETQCWDKGDKDNPFPIELKSETFLPFVEAFGK
jgi:hypothetical protein